MYDIIKNVILNENFDLSWIILNIKKNCSRGDITDDQEEELIVLAQKYAKPENSYAPLQKQIDDLYNKIKELTETVNTNAVGVSALKDAVEELLSIEIKPEEPTVDTEEYPEYVQPTGAHDAYNIGDKITFEGEKYTCKMNGCVWSPKDYPAGWEKIVEQSTLEEPPIVENVQI